MKKDGRRNAINTGKNMRIRTNNMLYLKDMLIKRVTNTKELNDVFRIRYDVYCLERGYERAEDCPSGFEMDEYDPYSLHFIAYVKSNPVGTARVILPNPLGLPVERYCNVDIKTFCSDTVQAAEISRLAVSSEATKGFSINRGGITLSLIRELFKVAAPLNVKYVFSAMSTGLDRMLKKCGIQFYQAGAPVEYHGIRTPYYASIDDLKTELSNNREDIFKFLFPETRPYNCDGLSPSYISANNNALMPNL